MNALKSTLALEALDAREVPAVLSFAKITPVPIPPSVAATVVVSDVNKWAPPPPFASPVASEKAGILLPALNKYEPTPPVVAPNAILFPVFVGK